MSQRSISLEFPTVAAVALVSFLVPLGATASLRNRELVCARFCASPSHARKLSANIFMPVALLAFKTVECQVSTSGDQMATDCVWATLYHLHYSNSLVCYCLINFRVAGARMQSHETLSTFPPQGATPHHPTIANTHTHTMSYRKQTLMSVLRACVCGVTTDFGRNFHPAVWADADAFVRVSRRRKGGTNGGRSRFESLIYSLRARGTRARVCATVRQATSASNFRCASIERCGGFSCM